MLIDTHAHLYHERLLQDQDDVIRRLTEAGVLRVVMPAIDVPSIQAAIDLCNRHEGFYAMAAIHPSDVRDATDEDFEAVVSFCDHPSVVAVGETGLDYYWDRSFDQKQHDYLRRHIRLAAEKDLPLVFHNRQASEDLLSILKDEIAGSASPERIRGIFHCFGGPYEYAEQIFELGFLVGIGGTVTFKNSGVAELVARLPLERIVLETDAPFLAPVPHRGKRNEPAYVRLVAEEVSRIRGIEVETVEAVTTRNAMELFRLA